MRDEGRATSAPSRLPAACVSEAGVQQSRRLEESSRRGWETGDEDTRRLEAAFASCCRTGDEGQSEGKGSRRRKQESRAEQVDRETGTRGEQRRQKARTCSSDHLVSLVSVAHDRSWLAFGEQKE